VVGVTTTAKDPDGDALTYNYATSAGRIVGSGANVNWDLSGLRPGTYTITASVDDGCGFCGKTQTKTITVKECPDCIPVCDCPSGVSVTGPSGLTKIGDTMTFTASVNGGSQSNPSYNWTVSGGEIASGQGTNVITVNTTREMAGQTVTATVEATGFCDECKSFTGSASGEVEPSRDKRKVDEFPPTEFDDLKLRWESFESAYMSSNQTDKIYVVIDGKGKAKARQRTGIDRAIKFLNLDASRFVFVDGDPNAPVSTRVWVVPEGAEPPSN
jgi:hypothetical protein